MFNNLQKQNANYLKNLNNNNLLEIEKLRKEYDNLNIDNKSNINILSENNSNKNTNITTQRKTLNKGYLLTDVNNNPNINFSKDCRIKLLLLNKINSTKKISIKYHDNNSSENISKLSGNNVIKNKNNKKEENNIKNIKLYNRNYVGNLIRQNYDYLNKSKEQKIKKKNMINSYDAYYLKEEEDFDCPEELHFYYIRTLHIGKKSENRF